MSDSRMSPHIGDLTGKIALVTGASSGLGRAIALAYAAAGAYVVNADLTPNPSSQPTYESLAKTRGADVLTPTADLINSRFPAAATTATAGSSQQHKQRAVYVQCDVTSGASMQAAVQHAVHTFGRLDIMCNNAGIAHEMRVAGYAEGNNARIHETDESVFDKDMAVNAKGAWLGMKYACQQMLAQEPHVSGDRGWCINIASVMSLVANPGASPYCASKGAVIQMTKAVALEYAHDRIHCNCIAPGFVETGLLEPMMKRHGVEGFTAALSALHPWGRLAQPSEIANMAVFLAGPGASFVTGAPYLVDGGYTAL